MTDKTWQAVYTSNSPDPSVGEARLFEAHARTWWEAAHRLPRYLYPAGRTYRRTSGPFRKQDVTP